ncbi:MAG: DEAD/DEAH box helicase [Paludibacteraceae bacterium]|nr:DEAD/DEAH box helicase [Paludibacteraceae bacterium]
MNDIFDSIEALTEREKAYMCFMAYTGKDINNDVFKYPDIEGLGEMDFWGFNKLKAGLKKKGMLRENSFFSQWIISSINKYYEIEPSVYAALIVYMLERRKEWRKLFFRYMSHVGWHDAIIKIGAFMCDNEVDLYQYLTSVPSVMSFMPEYAIEVIEGALNMDGREILVKNLPDDLMANVYNDLLCGFQKNGDVSKLQLAKKLMSKHRGKTNECHYMHSLIRRDWFYCTGEIMPEEETDAGFHATMYLDAALMLYAGKVDAAIKMYEKGIKASSGHIKVKGTPKDALTELMYVIALGIRRSANDVEALQKLADKIKKQNEPENWAVGAFVTYLKDGQQTVTNDFRFLKNVKNVLARAIVNLFRVYAGEKPLEQTSVEMDCALLRNEFWGMGKCDEKGGMPYEPLLAKIKRKEQWEVKIEAIMAKAGGKEAPEYAGERTVRTIYYVQGYNNATNIVDVKVQKKAKKGGWTKGAMMSETNWYFKNFDMDAIDTEVYDEWKKLRHKHAAGSGSFPKLSTVLRCCKGTDKLYTDYADNGYGPVEIIEEKPYIYTERKDGCITFYSNIPEKSLNNLCEWSSDRHSITYWELNDDIKDIFVMVAKLGNVPESAEPMLEKMTAMLKDKVEIQSDIQGAMRLEEKEGNSILTVRVTPESTVYEARFMVRPLDGGCKYLEVGKGDEVIVDSDGTTRYKVTRNIKREKSNCKKICDLLGFERTTNNTILNTERLLILMDSADEMKDVFCIEWPKGEALKIVKPSASAWNINAAAKAGWFELEGELRVSEGMVLTIAQLLEMARNGEGQYVRLSSGEYLKLSKKIRAQLNQLDAVSQNTRGKITVSELAMTFMKDAIDDIVDVEEYEMVEERKRLMRDAANKDYPLPEGLNAVLRPYQEDGYRWLMSLSHWGAGACLADDMGLGKTVQSIAFMLSKAGEGPQMVVAPASVIGNWRKELARFSPGLKVMMLNEMAPGERGKALDSVGEGSIVVVTYGLLVTEKEAVTKVKWTTVVLDEAHTIKNKETKMSSVAMKLQAINKIMLTGTPVQNHLGELWNLFRFINPGLLGTYEHFQEKFVGSESNGSREALKRLVAPFLLRRTKNEVVRELPDKVEVTIPVQMQEDEMAIYEIIRRQAKAELEMGGPLSVNALAMMTKLRMTACSAMLAEKSWKGGCSKLDALIEKLMPIVESGNSVLVFSQFTSFLTMARERLEREGLKSYLYLDGSTPVAKRQKMVEQFQNGGQQVFLISLKAGGLGLNLTGASYVIHLDPWWNPAIEQQATDRAYRIGQQQKVTVYHLIAEGTIEEKIVRLHDTKREMADSILDGRSTAMRLTPEELMELIKD